MKAEERKDVPKHPAPGVAEPPNPHHHAPTVAEGVGDIFAWLRSAVGTVNGRVVGLLLALGLVAGVWWFFAREGRRADSARWTELEQLSGLASLDKYAEANPNTVSGRVARLEEARRKFGPNGVAKMARRDDRADGIKAVEEARAEFVKLAGEFSGDAVMKAECLAKAAEAELALVGVPKDGSQDFRGTVGEATKFLRELAKTVGPETAAGVAATKRADDLEKNADEVRRVGQLLNSQLTPMPIADIKTPPSLAPATPSGPVETPKPPTGALTSPATK
jgi:hypothetical protein